LLQGASTSGKQIVVNTHSLMLPHFLGGAKLLLCRKQQHETVFWEPLPLFGGQDVTAALAEDESEIALLMERIMRGDYGG
jgi:hypothetical protein